MRETYLPIFFGMISFALILIWLWQFNRHIEPRLRGMVSRRFNVEITRGTHWRVSDSRGAGCQLFLWEFLIVFVIGACVPLLILAAMFLALFAVYD